MPNPSKLHFMHWNIQNILLQSECVNYASWFDNKMLNVSLFALSLGMVLLSISQMGESESE